MGNERTKPPMAHTLLGGQPAPTLTAEVLPDWAGRRTGRASPAVRPGEQGARYREVAGSGASSDVEHSVIRPVPSR